MAGEVASLATEVVQYASAAIAAYGGAVLAKTRDDAADATVSLGRRLLQKIFGSRRPGEPAPTAVADLAEDPGDNDAIAALRLAVRKALAADPGLQAEIRGLLAGAGVTVTASGRGIAGVNLSGQFSTGDNTRFVTLDARTITPPALVSPQPGLNNLPRPPAQVFEGRAERGKAHAVHGLGDVGKSELALQYASAHRDSYQLSWWVTAASAAQIEVGLAELAGRLCPPVAMAGTTPDAAAWAMGWLQAHDRWLLVLDNVDNAADVEPLLAQLTGGHIIVTTRRDTGWQRTAIPIRLDVLDPASGTAILTAQLSEHPGHLHADAAAIARELGYLPLALDQAAAYLSATREPPSEYLASLRHGSPAMDTADKDLAQQTIARLFDLTLAAITARDPGAVDLLRILACYSPDDIPRAILGTADNHATTSRQLALLASYSMINLTTDTVTLHRLVQAVILDKTAPSGNGHHPAQTALSWLDAAIPADPFSDVTGWSLLRALAPHADVLHTRFPGNDQPLALARVANQLGLFHQAQGEHQLALRCYEQALRSYEAELGPDHPDTALIMGNLARTYNDLGRGDCRTPSLSSGGPCRSPKPGSEATTPTPRGAWATSPAPITTSACLPARSPCSSAPWASSKPSSDPTIPAPRDAGPVSPAPTTHSGGPPAARSGPGEADRRRR